jgi:hypothetical protein
MAEELIHIPAELHYELSVNDDTKNPRIVEVIRELVRAAPIAL